MLLKRDIYFDLLTFIYFFIIMLHNTTLCDFCEALRNVHRIVIFLTIRSIYRRIRV